MGVVGIVDDVTKVVGSSFLASGPHSAAARCLGPRTDLRPGSRLWFLRVCAGDAWRAMGTPAGHRPRWRVAAATVAHSTRGRESRRLREGHFGGRTSRYFGREVFCQRSGSGYRHKQRETQQHPGAIRRNAVPSAGFVRPSSRRRNPTISETAPSSSNRSGHNRRRRAEDQHRRCAGNLLRGCRVRSRRTSALEIAGAPSMLIFRSAVDGRTQSRCRNSSLVR